MSPALTQIVVRLRADIARALHAGATEAAGTAEMNEVLRRFGLELQPQQPRTSDAALKSYFTISNVPIEQAEQVAAALRRTEPVEAAYVQPPVSPA